MAYARALSTRATIIARRCNPSFAYVLHDDNRKHESPDRSQSEPRDGSFVHSRSFGTGFYNSTTIGSFLQEARSSNFSLRPSNSYVSCHYMSTTAGDGFDKAEMMTDVADVLTDTAIDVVVSQAPVVNEVAIAAADSVLPVAALQHCIDAVHSFSGLNWWASIAVTTLIIRTATLPLLINQLKSTAKLSLMRTRLEELKLEMDEKMGDPRAAVEFQVKMRSLFKEYGVSPLTPLKGLLIQGPIFVSFFYAITNMADKVPSFKTGGALWFTDLTTPDSFYVLPVLMGLSFLMTVECNMQEGMEGNPMADTMKKFSRIFAVLAVPFTATLPKAIFCYWVTSNLFSLGYGLVLKAPGVKAALGLPETPKPPPNAQPKPSAVDLFAAIRKSSPTPEPTSEPVESRKVSERTISSSSIVSQRLRSLEKQVKERKKNLKR